MVVGLRLLVEVRSGIAVCTGAPVACDDSCSDEPLRLSAYWVCGDTGAICWDWVFCTDGMFICCGLGVSALAIIGAAMAPMPAVTFGCCSAQSAALLP